MFDLPGMLVVVVLMALFGFLARRAWRLRNPALRWAGAIVAGLLALLPALVGGLTLNGYAKLNQRYDNPVSALTAEGNSAQIARGQQLAHTCQSCHATNGQLPLSGTNFLTKFDLPPLGTLYAPNLTPGGNIDDWTDGELVRAIREGISRDGRSLLIMPANVLRNLSDDDVLALVAYLRAQPPTGEPTPATRFNLLGALFTNLADFRTAQPPVGSVTAPPFGTPGKAARPAAVSSARCGRTDTLCRGGRASRRWQRRCSCANQPRGRRSARSRSRPDARRR